MEEKPSYYGIMPASVRYDKELSPLARILYVEISCLTNQFGYCKASNEYFSKLYEVHPNSISRLVNSLKKKGYINIESKIHLAEGGERKEERKIYLTEKINTDVVPSENKKKRTPKVKADVPMFEKEFVKMPLEKYQLLVSTYGEVIVNRTIDRMIGWCNQNTNYYKDYYKSMCKWLEGTPKLEAKPEPVKLDFSSEAPVFDILE